LFIAIVASKTLIDVMKKKSRPLRLLVGFVEVL
jgi:hypothetical protein